MIALLQRAKYAQVSVNDKIIGKISQGVLAFIGIQKHDTQAQANRLTERILGYRIFQDSEDKMNLSVKDIQGGVLLIPQFTLAADTKKGMRPSFTDAAEPAISIPLFDYIVTHMSKLHAPVQTGQFGANMQVSLCNDGPATFILKTSV